MAQNYFTSEHFKLLNKWKEQKRDESNPEQNRAYAELAEAYKITEEWVNQVRKTLFPTGSKMDIRKRPTNQSNNFIGYNWAKIYPRQDSPKEITMLTRFCFQWRRCLKPMLRSILPSSFRKAIT
jgi:5-methylcytosine-specific restriction enzyme B